MLLFYNQHVCLKRVCSLYHSKLRFTAVHHWRGHKEATRMLISTAPKTKGRTVQQYTLSELSTENRK